LVHFGLQHLADGPVDGFHGVGSRRQHADKWHRRPAPYFIPRGTRAAANNFFVARCLASSCPRAVAIGAATFRAINVLSHNLHLSITGRARPRAIFSSRDLTVHADPLPQFFAATLHHRPIALATPPHPPDAGTLFDATTSASRTLSNGVTCRVSPMSAAIE
jgi:hypothetical protein